MLLYYARLNKKPVLIPLEKEGLIEVDASSRTAKWGFPARTTFRFLENARSQRHGEHS